MKVRGQTEDRWPSFTQRKNPPICVLAVARQLPVLAARSLVPSRVRTAGRQQPLVVTSQSFHYLGQQGQYLPDHPRVMSLKVPMVTKVKLISNNSVKSS